VVPPESADARWRSLYDAIIGPWGSTETFGLHTLPSYQERDREVIDYELFLLPGSGHQVRGPAPKTLAPGQYFTCVGAAQTFGCFCERPYPALLADGLDLSVLNLGLAGAGPRLFLENEALLEYINEGRFAILQVLSGRSEDNSLFESGGRGTLTRRSNGQEIRAEPAYGELLANEGANTVDAIVAETRANWVKSFSMLLEAIEVPTILFWFSKRPPDYEESYSDVRALFGEYPQLVNRAMMEEIRALSDEYVECVSTRGIPQRLVSRFARESTSSEPSVGQVTGRVNTYYPSPEMHADAAGALAEACRKYAH
jgi:hypothetical protein